MLKVYIARHGQDEDNAKGVLNGHRSTPLTNLGHSQARQLAQGISKLPSLNLARIYASPLRRAHETASVIAKELKSKWLKPHIEPDLIERDFGVMTGVPVSLVEHLCAPDIIKTETITYFLSPKGAETFPVLVERAHRLLAKFRHYHARDEILCVTHGDIGKMLYVAYYGLDWREFLPKFHFGNCELLVLSPDSNPDEPHVIKMEQHNG